MRYSDEVLADRPLGYWRLDSLLDSSGHGLTLTDGNTTGRANSTAVVGDPCRGRTFNGTNQYLSVGLNLTAHNAIAIEAWMIWPTYANDDIIGWAFGSAGERFFFDPNSSAPFAGLCQINTNEGATNNGGGYPRFSAAVWHHVVATYKKRSGTALGTTLWVDGVEVTASSTVLNTLAGGSATYPNSTLFIGSYFGPVLYSSATMQDVAVYGGGTGGVLTGLGAERIKAHYQVGRGNRSVTQGRLARGRR